MKKKSNYDYELDETSMKALAEHLIQRRVELGLSQAELGLKLGHVNADIIQTIETGKATLLEVIHTRIHIGLNIELEDFLALLGQLYKSTISRWFYRDTA